MEDVVPHFVNNLAVLQQVCPEVRDGTLVATYDSVVYIIHIDDIYDPGIIAVERTPMFPRHRRFGAAAVGVR